MTGNNFLIHHTADEDDELLNEHVVEPGDPDGVVAGEKQREWQDQHRISQAASPDEYPYKRRWPWVLAGLGVLILVATGAFLLGSHQVNHHSSAPSVSGGNQKNSTPPHTASSKTEHYDSNTFSLSFDYPQGWTVSDQPTKLTVTSPALQLMTAVGATTSAHVVVTILNQQTSIPGFPATGAVAALTSDNLAYAQPSSVQRAQTYVSYLSYTEPNGLDALFVTGDHGYQQGQVVPASDIVQGNPLISVGFEKCANSTCATGAVDSVTLQASSWKASGVGKDITNLIKSIVVNG